MVKVDTNMAAKKQNNERNHDMTKVQQVNKSFDFSLFWELCLISWIRLIEQESIKHGY